MQTFAQIKKRAVKRKGGEKVLADLVGKAPDERQLAKMADDRILAEMTRRIFCSGFSWRVVNQKWPGFETAFHGFDPRFLAFQPDEYWDELTSDTRIVRHGAKIMSVRHNAAVVLDLAKEHKSAGGFLANWPSDDLVGLLRWMGKVPKRLGGNTGQYFLRFIGKDSFLLTRDVVACLKDAGLEIADEPRSKRDLEKIQKQFNTWHTDNGMAYAQLSKICGLSVGENHSASELLARQRGA